MSINFNLLDDTNITATFGEVGTIQQPSTKNIPAYVPGQGFGVVFIGQEANAPQFQLHRNDQTQPNPFDSYQTLTPYQTVTIDINPGDAIAILPNQDQSADSDIPMKMVYSNQPFSLVSSDYGRYLVFSVAPPAEATSASPADMNYIDITKPIIITEAHSLILNTEGGEGTFKGTITFPGNIMYAPDGSVVEKQVQKVDTGVINILPYNTDVSLTATVFKEDTTVKGVESILATTESGGSEVPLTLYKTTVGNSMVAKGMNQTTSYWIFIVLLLILLVFLVFRYRNSHR